MYKQYLLIQRAQWYAKHKPQIEFLSKLEQKVKLTKYNFQNHVVLKKYIYFKYIYNT